MNNFRLLAGILSFVLIAGLASPAFAQLSTDIPNNPPAATNDINPPEVCDGSDVDLLIQDKVPWSVNVPGQDPRGAMVNELIAQGKNWCAIGSDAIGTTDLSQFNVIITTPDQTSSYYANLFPGNTLHPDIDAWVQSGGVLSASLADQNYLSPNGVTMPQGMIIVWQPLNDNNIVDATHPLITGASPCPSGNCGTIVDVGPLNELDGWGSSNHNHFANLPAGAIVIIEDANGNPVAVEYNHGAGVIIANGMTDTWRYSILANNPQLELVANDIAYQNALGSKVVGGEFLSIDSVALMIAGLQSSAVWMIPILAGAAGVSAFYLKSRINKE